MKNILIISLFATIAYSDGLEYSQVDLNPTSETFELNVWHPEYTSYITLHYFSSQG